MKHLKAKLMGAVVMLLISALMLSTASYAWFTISTAPEVTGVDTQLAANGNLEIALATDADFTTAPTTYSTGTDYDTGKNATWGNVVSLSAMADSISLKPVRFTASDGSIDVPTFGVDGRISGFTDATSEFKAMTALNSSASGSYTDGGVTVYKNGSDLYAYRVDFFMRTNTAGSVKLLQTGADRGAGENGAGTTITSGMYDKGVRVYFKVDSGAATSFLNADGFDFTTALFTEAEAGLNTTHKVSMYVIWDGDSMDNADFTNAVQDLKLNVQFTHSATLTDIGIDGTGSSVHTD